MARTIGLTFPQEQKPAQKPKENKPQEKMSTEK